MKRSLGVTVGALVLAAAPPLSAQSAADVDAARELFREGSRLGLEGRWDEARDRYARSLGLKHAAITLYSLGVAQRRLGKLAEALECFRAFVVEPRTPATAPYEQPARDAIAELERRVARLALSVDPGAAPGLVVTIDGDPVPAAALGVPRLVNPGPHEIVAAAGGYHPARAAVRSAEGSVQPVKLTLVPSSTDRPARSALPEPEAPSRTLPIALMAAGGAVFTAGLALGIVGVNEASRAPTRDGPEAGAAKAKALAGDIVAGAGVAAVAAGVIVLLVRRSPAELRSIQPRSAEVTPWLGAREAGIRVRF